MVIRKGSIYWVDFSPGKGSEPMERRPGLVVQNDLLNDSKLNTVIVVAITSTLRFGELPGNIILQKGEAVDKHSLKEKIGSLTKERLADVYEGMKLIMDIH
jgi:mRNA interferase MazF